jgi:hypothetical protein
VNAGVPPPTPATRWAVYGAWLTLCGTLLSGPLSLVLVTATHPQPAWAGAAPFVRHYHPLQTLPFFLGFLLVGGLVAPVFAGGGLARATRIAFVANGPVSVASAFATAVIPGWALTTAGLVAFTLWNALVVVMAVLVLLVLGRRAVPADLSDAALPGRA